MAASGLENFIDNMDINECTTEKTKLMLENLRSLGYAIELEVAPERFSDNENCWGMEPVFKILAPNGTVNKAAFTHELLHIHIYSLGFVGDEVLRKVIDDGGTIFSAELLFKVNNNLAHFKMIGPFQRLGFKKEEFLNDNLTTELDECCKRVEDLRAEGNKFELLQRFIGEFSILKFYQNFENLNSADCLSNLKSIDENLYQIVDRSFEEWIASSGANNLKFFTDLKQKISELK